MVKSLPTVTKSKRIVYNKITILLIFTIHFTGFVRSIINILFHCSYFAVHEDILLTVATTESQAGRYLTEILSEISSFKHSKL